MSSRTNESRGLLISRSAVEVLGGEGAAGLTHRAVDRRAGLPEGSTSNLYRTRAALIAGVCDYLTGRDLAQLRVAADRLSAISDASLEDAAAGLADIVEQWAGRDAIFTCARYELFLAARRNGEIADRLERSRDAFREFTRTWMESIRAGSGVHLPVLFALVEGLTMAQLLHPSTRLSRAELESEMRTALGAIL